MWSIAKSQILLLLLLFSLSVVSSSFVTPWTVAHQLPRSMGFSRQEYWSGLPFLSPENLSYPGSKPCSPALVGGFFTTEPPGRPKSRIHIFNDNVRGAMILTSQEQIPVWVLGFPGPVTPGFLFPQTIPPCLFPPSRCWAQQAELPGEWGGGSLKPREASLGLRWASSMKNLFSWYAGVETGPQGLVCKRQ